MMKRTNWLKPALTVFLAMYCTQGSALACSMTSTPAPMPQAPLQVGRVKNVQSSMPSVTVQTDVLNGNPQQINSVSVDGTTIDADGLVDYNPELDPEVLKCKAALEKTKKHFFEKKWKYKRWIDRLSKKDREDLKKSEENAKQKYKEFMEDSRTSDRANKALGDAQKAFDKENKKYNDPATPAKDKPTEKQLDDLRQTEKTCKEHYDSAKEKAAESSNENQKAEKDLNDRTSKAFPGQEKAYENDRAEFEKAQKELDQANSKLELAQADANRG